MCIGSDIKLSTQSLSDEMAEETSAFADEQTASKEKDEGSKYHLIM